MKYYNLTKKEEEILNDVESGEFESVKDEKETYESYARASLSKTKNINIRLAEKDVHKLKSIAAEKGMPYQTLASSILHQYSNRKKGRAS